MQTYFSLFPFTFHLFTIVLVGIFGIWLMIWVYLSDRKNKINQNFSLMSLFILLWIFFGFLSRISVQPSLNILFYKLNLASVSLMFIFVYFLSVYFPKIDRRYPILDRLVLIFNIPLSFTILFTNLIVSDVKFQNGVVNFILGKGGLIFYLMVYFLTIFILFTLIKKYFTLSLDDKLRVQYFIIGGFIFAIANLIVNVTLPLFREEFRYYWFGDYSMIIWIGLTAYAIVARELFGIRVILTQALVGVIAILLLWQAVIAIPNWFEFSWKFALFLLFLIFGYFLIQSVVREIQRRAELQRLYDELEKLDEAKTEFMSIVSHQLRTPLTAIKGYVSMIMEGLYGSFAEKIKKPLDNVFASNERLIKFVNDILNVTRIETGRLEFIPEKTSMEEVISSVVFELEIKSKEKNLYLKWEEPEEPLPQILIDPDKIRQVILNLIDNAIKYTKEGGVTVKCKVQNEKYRIEVSDTGAGMTQEDIQKLFRSFSRGESGVTYYKEGTGLGLYIARQFVEMQGGKVWAESEGKGKGSTFYIELPIK